MEPYICDGVNWLTFCAPHSGRAHDVRMPFVFDGWLYATDGMMVIRRKVTAADHVREKTPCELMRGYFTSLSAVEESQWVPWPTNAVDLPVCKSHCECWDHSRFEVPVEWCQECDGSGIIWNVDWSGEIRLTGTTVSLPNWRRVSCLPSVEYLPPAEPNVAIRFRFRDGEGLLMPVYDESNPEKYQHAKEATA